MPSQRHLRTVLLAASIVAAACGGTKKQDASRTKLPVPTSIGSLPAPAPLDAPAAPGSIAPRLTTSPDGGAIASWLEPDKDGVALRWATLAGSDAAWSEARTVFASPKILPNAADVPGVVSLGGGRLVAHWRETREPDGGGYDIKVSLSFDAGASWEETVTPHRDGTNTEHGFLAVYEASQPQGADGPTGPGKIRAGDLAGAGSQMRPTGEMPPMNDPTQYDAGLIWLDGRDAATNPESFAAQLVSTTLESGGLVGLGLEQVIDPRTCDCCPMSVAHAGNMTLLAYRDRSPEDFRDIWLVRRPQGGDWSAPQRVHEDAWHVVGCPVNGPSVDADGKRAAVAWFTASQDDPRLLIAFSKDSGATWSEPVRLDDPSVGMTGGQPALSLLPDGSALVVSVVRRETGSALVARRVAPGAAPGPTLELGTGVLGVPMLARSNGRLVVGWTERSAEASAPAGTSGASPPSASRRVRCASWSVAEIVGSPSPS